MPKTKPYKSVWSKEQRAVVSVLVACRKEVGLSQTTLSTRMGWSQSTIAKIENGDRRLDVAEFIMLAKAMGIEPQVVFDRVVRW